MERVSILIINNIINIIIILTIFTRHNRRKEHQVRTNISPLHIFITFECPQMTAKHFIHIWSRGQSNIEMFLNSAWSQQSSINQIRAACGCNNIDLAAIVLIIVTSVYGFRMKEGERDGK